MSWGFHMVRNSSLTLDLWRPLPSLPLWINPSFPFNRLPHSSLIHPLFFVLSIPTVPLHSTYFPVMNGTGPPKSLQVLKQISLWWLANPMRKCGTLMSIFSHVSRGKAQVRYKDPPTAKSQISWAHNQDQVKHAGELVKEDIINFVTYYCTYRCWVNL